MSIESGLKSPENTPNDSPSPASELEQMANKFDPEEAQRAVEKRKAELESETAAKTAEQILSNQETVIYTESVTEKLGDGTTTTASIYIENSETMSDEELKEAKGKPDAYTAERQAWHDEVIKEAIEAVKQLSEILGDPPRIIAARGCCGSGKTTAFKELFKKIERGMELFNDKGDIPGAVKPDYFKDVIKDEARANLGIEITSSQTHMESTGICKMFAETIKNNPALSMIIDKQLEEEKDIKDIIKWGEETGKPVELLDNDVPIELSAFRVLKRKIGGADPNIEFSGVTKGFVGIRANRAEAIKDTSNPIVASYSLRVFDPATKQQIEIASKDEQDNFRVKPGYEKLYDQVTGQDKRTAEEEAAQAANQVITKEYVEEFISKYFDESEGPTKWSTEARDVLGAYVGLGITLGEALDSKAAGINPDRDSKTGELIDPHYREKVSAFVQEKRRLAQNAA